MKKYFISTFMGTTINNLSLSAIRNAHVLIPNSGNQLCITRYIHDKFDTIDKLIVRAEKEIEHIQEYRTRLISDTVTGKIDVRDIEIPDFEQEVIDIDSVVEDDIEEEVL
jgi:type I restriction enzyme S subunit